MPQWDLQERGATQQHPLATHFSPPVSPQARQMRHLCSLCLMLHCQGYHSPTMLQTVQPIRGQGRPLLVFVVLPLPLAWWLVVSVVDEAFCSPLHLIQKVEVAAGTRHRTL